MAQVKGVAIIGLIKFIKKNYKDSLDQVVNALPSDSAHYMQEHILLTQWYPYKLYTDLLRALDKVIGKGDLSSCIEQGRLSALHDLSTIFKGFINFSNVQSLVANIMTIWTSYYDTGKSEMPLFTDKEASYVIKDFPEIDIAHVKNAEGWIGQYLVIFLKLNGIRSEVTKCQCSGDPITEIHFTFNP